MTATPLRQPEEQVLSTLNRDGSRRWLRPRLSKGRFLARRRALAWTLIAIFVVIPWIRIGGRPAILLDITHREFTFFGKTFLPTDTLLLMLLVVGIFLLIFLATALLGRVWCGWVCPQTVYMEFIFRPIERWAHGTPGRARPSHPGARAAIQYALYFAVSFALAHTFLSYFVGVDRLRHWVFSSPADHAVGFAVVVLVTLAMLFDFGFFREQMCIVACPYGRFQSVMLDRESLIVSYDPIRGEPRGKGTKKSHNAAPSGDLALKVIPERRGDCVDCGLCVATCPTGIDIRNGLQMECINCTQCIDACDAVMDKLSRPRGLIRYSSQSAIEGERRRFIRPRVFLYPAVLLVIASLFVWRLSTMHPADVTFFRGKGMPFNELPSGEIANQFKIRIVNRSDAAQEYRISLANADLGRLITESNPITLEKGEMTEEGFIIAVPRAAFRDGRLDVLVRVTDGKSFESTKECRLLGPTSSAPPHTASESKGATP
jgi:cytochrome c oxidase accessory protein FixG